MIRVMLGLGLAMVAGTAAADVKYDRELEQAAVRIVAQKMGDLRGGFAFDELPDFVRTFDRGAVGTVPSASAGWSDGLALAVGWQVRPGRSK